MVRAGRLMMSAGIVPRTVGVDSRMGRNVGTVEGDGALVVGVLGCAKGVGVGGVVTVAVGRVGVWAVPAWQAIDNTKSATSATI